MGGWAVGIWDEGGQFNDKRHNIYNNDVVRPARWVLIRRGKRSSVGSVKGRTEVTISTLSCSVVWAFGLGDQWGGWGKIYSSKFEINFEIL